MMKGNKKDTMPALMGEADVNQRNYILAVLKYYGKVLKKTRGIIQVNNK